MNLNHFTLKIENKIAHLAINRPEKANSLHLEAWLELREALLYCDQTPEVRAIILSGNGEKLFCAGIDLAMLMSTNELLNDDCDGRKREKFRRFLLDFQDMLTTSEKISKPILSAVHGGCIGGGLDIICATDMRYCTADAYFVIKEIDLGMVADLGTLQRLPKLMPDGLVRELAYTGRPLSAQEALGCGLVNRLFATKADMLTEVTKIAERIASKSPLSIRGTKRNLLYSRDHSVAESLEYMANWNAAMFYSQDLMEAFKASMTKEQPEFRD
ncbi:MAG: crotonase/enoyl-CoA hydratase family protein [Saprospiraceae bacterium]|nr:crotonase/enoyl-CoA hydratase family protein [Saprospiraceae bacterium]